MGTEKLLRVELALFYRDPRPTVGPSFAAEIQQTITELSDANDVIVLPTSMGVPEDVPVVVLRNESIEIQSSFSRLGIVYRGERSSDIETIHSGIVKRLLRSDALKSVRFKRIGYIKTYAASGVDPKEHVIAFTRIIAKGLKEHQLQLVYEEQFLEYECNRSVMVRGQGDIVELMVDLNTLPTLELDMDSTDVNKFVSQAVKRNFLDEIRGIIIGGDRSGAE